MIDARVKRLRINATPAEELLWHQFRDKRVAGVRFRRQFRIDYYIVDFVCLSARLVVEIDGESHRQTLEDDARRTRYLDEQGFRVVRFSNRDVMANLEGVVRTIELMVNSGLLPLSPSREGRGDRKLKR
ncbi:MAG: endonuclease domain-containing protein [Alphaproteobacteria bacterium]|nr:endonuclease domain-containing protein [Alphaproteobacteria bacterium]